MVGVGLSAAAARAKPGPSEDDGWAASREIGTLDSFGEISISRRGMTIVLLKTLTNGARSGLEEDDYFTPYAVRFGLAATHQAGADPP